MTIVKQLHVFLLDFVQALLLFLHFFLSLRSGTLGSELLTDSLNVNELYLSNDFLLHWLFIHRRLVQLDANLVLIAAFFRIGVENLLARCIVF